MKASLAVAVLLSMTGAAAADTMAVIGWRVDLPPGWSLGTQQDTIGDGHGGVGATLPATDVMHLVGAPAVSIELSKSTGQCFDEMTGFAYASKAGAGDVGARDAVAPSDWFPIVERRRLDDSERGRGVQSITIYCRDLYEAGIIEVVVESDGAHDADVSAALAAVDSAILAQVSPKRPAYQDSAQQLLDEVAKIGGAIASEVPSSPPPETSDDAVATDSYTAPATPEVAPASSAGDSSYMPPAPAPAPDSSTEADSDSRDHEPATYDTARWSLLGGQATLDGGMGTHLVGAARVAIAPRHIEYDDNGLVYSVAGSVGAAGDALLADAYGSTGYGMSGDGLAAGVLIAGGADRVGGGFEPETGLYVGLEGFARVGFGPIAFEGDAISTVSTSVDETRAQVGVVTHVGDRVLALDGFYARWDQLATIYGASLSLTR